MRHINYTLTPAKLNAARGRAVPYKLADGGGLFVRVSAAGTRTWAYGYSFEGKRREVTFGQYPEIGVKEARDRHDAARKSLANGIDPAAAKKEEKAARERAAEADAYVFKAFAERWIEERLADVSAAYRRQVGIQLKKYVYGSIGKKQLEEIKPRDVLMIMESLHAIPSTAERCRSLIKQVLQRASPVA